MSNRNLIPRKVAPYKEGELAHDVVLDERPELFYEPNDGELVRVILWERYPSYDIIFGYPDTTSPRHEHEIGFFTVRREGEAAHTGHYFDIKESQAIVEGFTRMLEISKTHSAHLWTGRQ